MMDKISNASHALKDFCCARMVQDRSTAMDVVAAANLNFGCSSLTKDMSIPMVRMCRTDLPLLLGCHFLPFD